MTFLTVPTAPAGLSLSASPCQAAVMAEDMESAAWAGQRAMVVFPEHVNVSTAAQVGEQLLGAFDRGAAVVIADMSATASCNDACVDAVASAVQQAAVRRAELRLVATAPAVRRQLAAQGLDRLVPVYPSVEAAVADGELNGPDFGDDPAPSATAPPPLPRLNARSGQAPLNQVVLRQMIDALADGIVLADAAGRIALANRQVAMIFGYRPGELTGQPVESLMPAGLRDAHRLDRAAYALKPTARPMADRARLVGLRKDGTTIPVTITLSPVPTASEQFVLAVVRDATYEHWRDDFTGVIQAVLAEQAHHAEELLDRVVGSLLHVGLSLDEAAGQPAELARERISGALERLDDTIHDIRAHVFRFRRPGGGVAW
jgi:PAS domain S-box-containing protein